MRRSQQQTITFEAYDSISATGALKTGLALLASDVLISKDGTAAVAATNAPVEITNMPGVYALVLTAAETNCGWLTLHISKSGMRPRVMPGYMNGQATASVVADGSNTSSTFVTDLTSAITDTHKGKLVRFQTGTLAGQVRKVTGFNATTKALSFTDPFSAAPSAGDVFTLIDD